MVLLMTRALGRLTPAGADTPSAYAAGARRSKSMPAAPQAGLVTLLPVPSMERKPDDCGTRGVLPRSGAEALAWTCDPDVETGAPSPVARDVPAADAVAREDCRW